MQSQDLRPEDKKKMGFGERSELNPIFFSFSPFPTGRGKKGDGDEEFDFNNAVFQEPGYLQRPYEASA
jgi:hypothetical protein